MAASMKKILQTFKLLFISILKVNMIQQKTTLRIELIQS